MPSSSNTYKWSVIDRVANTAITMAGNIILARMLTTADFGLLAMVNIFAALAYNLTGCGLGDGLIRKEDPTPDDYSTVFVFNTAVGVVFGSLFYLTAPLVADFFNEPDLLDIMRVIGICFAVQAMSLIQEIKLRKDLQMRTMAFVHLGSSVCAVGLGIWLAWAGYGFWGLVSCRIFLSVFFFIFAVIGTRWFPKFRFRMASFKEFFGFGVNLMLSYCGTIVSRYISATILGKVSSSASGLYSQAQKMQEVPTTIIDSSVTQTFFPVASNERDPVKRHELVTDMLSVNILLNVTSASLLFILAYPGFEFLFGDKWLAAVPVFRILLLFGILANLKTFIIEVMKLHWRSDLVRNLTVVELVVQVSILAVVYRWGMLWVALSQVAGAALTSVFYINELRKREKIGFLQILRLMLKPLPAPAVAFCLSLAAYLLLFDYLNSFVMICVILLVFASAFYIVAQRFPQKAYAFILRM